MNLNPVNIDFILVNYFSEDYAKIAIDSIYKFTKSPFNIILIDNSSNKELLKNKFKDFDKENFYIIDGYNQESPEERFKSPIKMYPTKGGQYGPGSLHHNKAFNLGIDLCKSKYICHLDIDSLFLDYWEDDILPLLETNLFISSEMSRDIAREYFIIWEREKFKNLKLRPDLTFVDTCGNLTKYAYDNSIPFHITDSLKDDTKFHFHLGRGTSLEQYGQIEKKQKYIKKWTTFLNS
jgi:glycosyltransferase involved in cell wall biosynthesis